MAQCVYVKLARKQTAAIILGIVVVMGGLAWFQLSREIMLYDNDAERSRQKGAALVTTLRSVWKNEGEERVRELVDRIAGVLGDVQVRWVRLDVPPDHPQAPHLEPNEIGVVKAGEVYRVVRADEDTDMLRRYIWVPLAPGEPQVIEMSEVLHGPTTFIRMSRHSLIGATVAAALVCGVIAMALGAWFVGRPIRQLRDKARRMGSGDFSGRLTLKQRDEIGELAEEMNLLADQLQDARRRLDTETEARIRAMEQLRHADRLATVGQLGAGVAHELGTPLNVISARAKMIAAGDAPTDEVTESARVIDEQADRMTDIIRQLLDFSRRGGTEPSEVDVEQVVMDTFELLSTEAEKRTVVLTFQAEGRPAALWADEKRLLQALTNVVLNGIQAMPSGGRLTVRAANRRVRPPSGHPGPLGDYVSIVVEDTGTGIPPGDLPHLFEPFFSTKGPGEGTGLGLAVAEGIVLEHGGWIDVESTVGQGTRFTLNLPPAGNAAQVARAS